MSAKGTGRTGGKPRAGGRRRGWLVWLRIVVALVVVGGGLLSLRVCDFSWLTGKPAGKVRVQLVRVADGDTITVRSARGAEIKVRLVGIDTPELGTAASFRSALFAAELLESAKEIWLEPDTKRATDKYGRTLGWVWVITPEGAELLLQEELIRAGLAELYRDAEGSKHYRRLERAR